jgi:C4-dicarboxylate transporter DctQ subunit
VDAFVKLLPPLMHRLASSIAVIGALTYCGLFFYGSWIYLSKMKKIGIELEDLPVPTWIAHSILIFGLALIVMRLVELLWSIVKGEADGFRHVDEAKESMHLAEELSAEAEKETSKEEPKS